MMLRRLWEWFRDHPANVQYRIAEKRTVGADGLLIEYPLQRRRSFGRWRDAVLFEMDAVDRIDFVDMEYYHA